MKTFFSRLFAGRPAADTVLVCSLSASLLFSQISISLTQGFMAVALAAWLILLIRKKRRFDVPVFFWALAVYAALSLVSSAVSVNPRMSFWDSRELLLILAVPVTLSAVRRKADLGLVLGAALVSASVNGVYSIFGRLTTDVERVEGFMSHYMTQAGITALFIAFALGLLFGGFGRRLKPSFGAREAGLPAAERIAWGLGLLLAAAANL
ncbi:MAG: hypothetical protein JW843_02565, partial [Candidatus Aminicenantes bacterium]|nr:hypothetical protein [Candidatus Aminicenantes bacterium]